jgi:uncharacterized membrane protein
MNSITTCVKTGVIYYAIALVYALIADVFWISIVAGPMYHTTFPTLIELKLFPAALFYLLFTAGLVIFTILPNRHSSLLKTVSSSAFFGLNVYGGYALTLLAVFNFFTPIMAMLEMLWGMTIAVFVATATINTALFISPTTKKK